MMTKRFVVLGVVVLLVSMVMVGVLVAAEQPNDVTDPYLALAAEETGMVASYTAVSESCSFSGDYDLFLCWPEGPAVLPAASSPEQVQTALEMLGTSGLILMPDSSNDRIMAFDPTTGNVVNPNFIPPDSEHFATPKDVILSASGTTLLVADQIADVVYEYDLLGNYLGIFAPIGGPNTAILDNIRGIALRPNGNLLVTVGGGGNVDAVAEFDTSGNYLGNFIFSGSGGLDSPFDIHQRIDDWLVVGSDNDRLQNFDLNTGAFISELASINNFPQQIGLALNDNILVANFGGTQAGIMEFTPVGGLVGIYDPDSSYRGVYELPNNNLLVSTSSGVYEVSRAGTIVDTKYVGTGAQFLQFVSIPYPLIRGSKTAESYLSIGDALTYTVSVQNEGIDGTGIVMTDAIPANTTYINGSLSCSVGSCFYDAPNDQITWNGDLANGDNLTISYAVDTSGVGCGVPIANQAIFSNSLTPFDTVLGHEATAWSVITTYDFEGSNGGFVSNTPPGEWAWGALVPTTNAPPTPISGSNLWATNLAGSITVEPSSHYLTKTLSLANGTSRIVWWDWWDGDGSDAGTVSVDGTAVYSVTADQNEWLFHELDLTPWQNQVVDFSFFYNAGGSGAGGAGWYVDDVAVLACSTESVDLSNSSKSAPVSVDSGSEFTYTIVIENSSGVDAIGVSMVDPIPTGLTYVNGSVSGGATYNAGQNQIEWDGDLGAGTAVTITFIVEATADSGMVTNTATIDHSDIEPVEVSASTTINAVVVGYKIYMPVVLNP